MPLIKNPTKQAFEKNVRKEIQSGRPVKQARAIAYSVQRTAAAKSSKKTRKKGKKQKLQNTKKQLDTKLLKSRAPAPEQCGVLL